MLQEEKSKVAQSQASEAKELEKKFRSYIEGEYVKASMAGIADPVVCAAHASTSILMRRRAGDDRVDALAKMIRAKEVLTQKEAFYLLGMDPTTQLPYINGKNEAIRDAQLVALIQTEREGLNAAEVELARAEVREFSAADDVDWQVATLYVHAAHGFRERNLEGAKAEAPPEAE